jgi:hypothetical protein
MRSSELVGRLGRRSHSAGGTRLSSSEKKSLENDLRFTEVELCAMLRNKAYLNKGDREILIEAIQDSITRAIQMIYEDRWKFPRQ